jgi:predicted nuclease of predicted toxin-antitoxin system
MPRGALKKSSCRSSRHEAFGGHEFVARLGAVLEQAGWKAIHWSDIGNPRAADSEIMAWAKQNGHVIFTHDLDFGTMLALTQAEGPSVIQVRTQDVTPTAIGKLVVNALRQFQPDLEKGALIVLDEANVRARVLPLTN